LIQEHVPVSKHIIMTFMTCDVSYAAFIAALICILATGVIMEKLSE